MNLFQPSNVLYLIILIISNANPSNGSYSYFSNKITAIFQSLDRLIGCRFSECCSTAANSWIPANMKGLSSNLNKKLHGQHLVKKVVPPALKAHFDNHHPSKALVLSFHGWTGGGKNFVSKIIAENIFKKGMRSQFVHLFVSTVHFPHADQADIYKLQIQDWIRGNVSECEHSMFIFDEIDKMPVGMINGIKPFIDYHDKVFGTNFRKSVFIFLSNTGGREIVKKMISNWKEGNERDSITYASMEDLIQKGAFNEQGGLHESDLIQHSLIDYYVPFLPLEKRHIKLCIRDELLRRKVDPTDDIFSTVLNEIPFFPNDTGLFSSKGCKSVATKVGYLLADRYFANTFNDEL